MEGKQHREFIENCQAVSEVMGEILMIAIVVLAFSSIAITVFSDKGVMSPPHAPRVDLKERIDRGENTVYILHQGGEAVDLKDINIVLNTGEKQEEFNISSNRSEFNYSVSNDILMLGDYIILNSTGRGINLTVDDPVMYFIHIPSQQVIQRVKL